MQSEFTRMMNGDLGHDRTSVVNKPMCASVCRSGALYFGTREEIERERPRSQPVNQFRFVNQVINTKVHMMVPRDSPVQHIDVTAASSFHQSLAGCAVRSSGADLLNLHRDRPAASGGKFPHGTVLHW